MSHKEFSREERQRKFRKSYESFSLGSISISSGELEMFDALERNKKNGRRNTLPHSLDFSSENDSQTDLSDSRGFPGFYGSFEEEKREYHEKNQQFLHKLSQQNPHQVRNKTPPRRDCLRSIYLSHPPTTGFSHRRLESIDNDDWEDSNSDPHSPENDFNSIVNDFNNRHKLQYENITSKQANDYVTRKKMRDEQKYTLDNRSRDGSSDTPPTDEISFEIQDFSDSYFDEDDDYCHYKNEYRQQKKNKRRKKKKAKREYRMDSDYDEISDSVYDSSIGSVSEKQKLLSKQDLIRQWMQEARAEFRAEEEERRADQIYNSWYNRFFRSIASNTISVKNTMFKSFSTLETAIANLPLTIGALSLAIVTLGTVWFKFAEENLDSCKSTHFHSSNCSYHEYPGCFDCDTSASWYKIALRFHNSCSFVAFILAFGFLLKVVFATRVIIDEMSSPTMSAPAGLMCVAMVSVFAGRGLIGEIVVISAAITHFFVAIWFGYMALAYRILPDPSWFPNTISIGYCGVKLWTYHSFAGLCYMWVSLILFFLIFPISLFRVYFSPKISAPVCWIQASAPSIVLYALTLLSQPMDAGTNDTPLFPGDKPLFNWVYLNTMHVMFAFSLIGMASSVHSLKVRWKDFKRKSFSPAHAAFGFPPLSHANAIQAYRGALDSFASLPVGGLIKLVIYWYWLFILISGSVLLSIITIKYFYHLPGWVLVDISDEDEPPAPAETMIRDFITTGETMKQDYINPAILQANEAGALVSVTQQDGTHRYRRTRKVTALGFDPIMDMIELETERQVLLDWVENNSPRARSRTLSVPVDVFNFNNSSSGAFEDDNRPSLASSRDVSTDHRRAKTMSYV